MIKKINIILITRPWVMLFMMIFYMLFLRISVVYCVEPDIDVNIVVTSPTKERLVRKALFNSFHHVLYHDKPQTVALLKNINPPSQSYMKLSLYLHNPIPQSFSTNLMLRKVFDTVFYIGKPFAYDIAIEKHKGYNMFLEDYNQAFVGLEDGFMNGSLDLRYHAYNNIQNIKPELLKNPYYFEGILDCSIKLYKNPSTTIYQKQMLNHFIAVLTIYKNTPSEQVELVLVDLKRYTEFYKNVASLYK